MKIVIYILTVGMVIISIMGYLYVMTDMTHGSFNWKIGLFTAVCFVLIIGLYHVVSWLVSRAKQ